LNGHSFPVIGVTPPSFFGVNVGDKFDVAIPICSEAILAGKSSMLDHHSSWWLSIVGRLKPSVSSQQATARLAVLAPEIYANALPPDWSAAEQARFRKLTFAIRPAGTGISNLRRQYERPLQILMVIVGLVLLIACANIASLLLARSAARQKEIAVRLSLGASRSRLIRQVLTESLALSGAGAVLGILFARWGSTLLVRFVSTSRQQVFLNLSMDGRVLGFTIGIAILTGLLFGILPALRATQVPLISAMKEGRVEDVQARSRFSSGRWIVAVQVALSLILLIGTGLFVRSFRNLITLDPGFARDHVLLVNTDIHNAHIDPAARASLYGHMLARLRTIPGVVSTSQCWFTPTEGAEWNLDIQVVGRPKATGDENLVWLNWTTPSYFSTMRTPLLEGRDFDGRDTATSPPVAVVNETMARHFFPNANPVGKYFSVDAGSMLAAKPIQIIGVVKDAKYGSLRESFLPTAYTPLAQIVTVPERTAFEIRTEVSPTSVIPSVRDAIANISKPTSLEFITLSQQVDDSLAQERLLAMLSAFFGILAVLLTAIGLYGVMAYVVTQRTHEIGIRMALGAQPASVLRLVMRDVAVLVGVGAGSGILASLWLTRLVQQLLFGVPATDAVTLSFAVVTLFVVVLLASYLPARRAMKVDPMVALRYE
ncbi:MAG: ABC transporter permease, partial [Candidatus Acidiferrales bacterium]